MSDFKVIETQEQFDAAISERLRRDRESYAKRFEGWLSPDDVKKVTDDYDTRIKALEDAAAATQQTIAEKDAEIAEGAKYRADLEKTRCAIAAGLDIKYAERLRGETKEEWEQDAKDLAKDFARPRFVAPLGNPEPEPGKASTREQFAAWMQETLNE